MVDFSSIAVFLLGTTTTNSRFPQRHRTYYESRVLPIHETWASFFPHLHFVFGTNRFDHAFLSQRCALVSEDEAHSAYSVSGGGNRVLLARTPQVPSQDKTELYHCPPYRERDRNDQHKKREGESMRERESDVQWGFSFGKNTSSSSSFLPSLFQEFVHFERNASSSSEHSNNNNNNDKESPEQREREAVLRSLRHTHRLSSSPQRPIQVLFTGNCTGEYFGIGPTCRCQETMRYFLRHALSPRGRLHGAKWFLFLDDDIHLRPLALVSLLRSLEQNASSLLFSSTDGYVRRGRTSRPFALISAGWSQGEAIRPKNTSYENTLACRSLLRVNFSFAQPAILNRDAMVMLRTAIDANALTRMHKLWGSSHDSILGQILWMHEIPTYSFSRTYYGEMIMVHGSANSFERYLSRDIFFMFHRVMNMNIYHNVVKGSPLRVKHTIASQHDIARITGDDVLYGNITTIDQINVHRYYSTLRKHWNIGARAARELVPMMNDIAGNSMVSRTLFAVHLANLTQRFELFTPNHCALLSPDDRALLSLI